ncbi:MAG: response regulator transcription factor [Chloroflexi bacterium]|nr:response regulator transcription factor [Chloroflexota bacterium]
MNPNEINYPARILVADDEANTRLALVRALQLSGYKSEGAANGREVLERLSHSCYDLLLLDLRMPEVNGEQVMEYIRRHHLDLAVIVLTAHATLDSAIASVKTGAVDYLLKPQRMADIELSIRQALQRNSAQRQRRQLIEAAQQTLQILNSEGLDQTPPPPNAPQTDFYFDRDQRLVTLDSSTATPRVISLTADQAAILSYMIHNTGRVLSGREIARNVLDYPEITSQEADKLIRSHVLRLRQKIESDPHHPVLIRTLRDAGYVFSQPDARESVLQKPSR